MNENCALKTLLTLTKSLTMIYINGVIESSNPPVRKSLKANLDQILEVQNDLYQSMKEAGYYEIANLANKDINKCLKKLTSE